MRGGGPARTATKYGDRATRYVDLAVGEFGVVCEAAFEFVTTGRPLT